MKDADSTPKTPEERQAERERRCEALEDTRDWLRLSGQRISPEAAPLFERYADGELSSDELFEALHRLYDRSGQSGAVGTVEELPETNAFRAVEVNGQTVHFAPNFRELLEQASERGRCRQQDNEARLLDFESEEEAAEYRARFLATRRRRREQ